MLGDSKSATDGYPAKLLNDLNAITVPNAFWSESTPRIATAGWTVDNLRTGVLANIASVTPAPNYVLINIGANDMGTAEVDWKADMQAILDAIHNQFPSAQVYIMRFWQRDVTRYFDSVAQWIADLVTLNSFAHLGPDERVFLENGDDGATYTTDGVHPTEPAGYQLTADNWRATLGY